MNDKKSNRHRSAHVLGLFAGGTARAVMVATAAIGGATLVGASVFASLNATAYNTSAQDVASGTLKLTQASSSVSGLTGGITTSITNLASGDIVNRFVDLTNGGSLDGKDLTLSLADVGTSLLTSDATVGLQVAVFECATAWTTVTGLCSGGAGTQVMSSTPAHSLLTTAGSLTVGSLAASHVNHLRLQITLPSKTETTVNGVLPGSTIQGLTSNLTWTFTEAQRLETVTQG